MSITFPETAEQPTQLDSIAMQVREQLSGRPLQFRLSPNERGLSIEAVVPTFYSKQLLLHAVRKASSLPIQDRISVLYPSTQKRSEAVPSAADR